MFTSNENSVIGLELRLVLLVLVSVPRCLPRQWYASPSWKIVVPSLTEFLRMLTSSHPSPSLLRSRTDFSTSVGVRIPSFDIELSDSDSLMVTLPGLSSRPAAKLFWIFCSSRLTSWRSASGSYSSWSCLCLQRYLRMSVPCVLLSVFTLCSQQLMFTLQLEL